MSKHLTEAATQLSWWLRLPPTNLIDRGDHVRFRYAVYLMIHQIATVLYGINGLPEIMYYPSQLDGARNQLDRLVKSPKRAGTSLCKLASERAPQKAWADAAILIRATLELLEKTPIDYSPRDQKIKEGAFKSDQSRDPNDLYTCAADLANRLQFLEGVEIIALGGSLGRGFADRQSDIDLLVFGAGIPQANNRRRLISTWPSIRYGPLIEPACDSVLIDGVMVHVRYWTTRTVDEMLAEFPKPPAQRILVEELQCSQGLVDKNGRLLQWKQSLEQLSPELIAVVFEGVHARLPRFRRQWEIASTSNERIHLYCLINQAVNDLLIALYIRNGRFLSTPRWSHKDIQTFDIVPPKLETSLPQLVDGISDEENPGGRWHGLEEIWAGMLHMPSG